MLATVVRRINIARKTAYRKKQAEEKVAALKVKQDEAEQLAEQKKAAEEKAKQLAAQKKAEEEKNKAAGNAQTQKERGIQTGKIKGRS